MYRNDEEARRDEAEAMADDKKFALSEEPDTGKREHPGSTQPSQNEDVQELFYGYEETADTDAEADFEDDYVEDFNEDLSDFDALNPEDSAPEEAAAPETDSAEEAEDEEEAETMTELRTREITGKFEELIEMLDSKHYTDFRTEMEDINPVDAADFFNELPLARIPAVFKLLKKDTAADVFAELDKGNEDGKDSLPADW